MKIFRASLSYCNGEFGEYEEVKSSLCSTRELAEKHLPMLSKYMAYLMNKSGSKGFFSWEEPVIEEIEVADEFIPIRLEFEKVSRDFEKFSFIPYNGPKNINKLEMDPPEYSITEWPITMWIGDEAFKVSFSWNYETLSEAYYIRKVDQDSVFWQYYPEDRKMLFGVCEDFVKSILPLYIELSTELKKKLKGKDSCKDKVEFFETTETVGCKYLRRLLDSTNIPLTDGAIEAIKGYILDCTDSPISDALKQLIK